MLKIQFCVSVLLAGVCQAYITDVSEETTYATDVSEETTYAADVYDNSLYATEVPKSDPSAFYCAVGKQCFGDTRYYTIQAPDNQYRLIASEPNVTTMALLDPKMYLPEGLAVEAGVKYILRTFSKDIEIPCPLKATPTSDEAQDSSAKCPDSDGAYITSADACPEASKALGYITTTSEDTQDSGYHTDVPTTSSEAENTQPKGQEEVHTVLPKAENETSTIHRSQTSEISASFTIPSKAEDTQPETHEETPEGPQEVDKDKPTPLGNSQGSGHPTNPEETPEEPQEAGKDKPTPPGNHPADPKDDGVQSEDKKDETILVDKNNQPDDQSTIDTKVTQKVEELTKEDPESALLNNNKLDSDDKEQTFTPQQVTSQKDIPVSLLDHQELVCPQDSKLIHIKDNQFMCSSIVVDGTKGVTYTLLEHQELVCPQDSKSIHLKDDQSMCSSLVIDGMDGVTYTLLEHQSLVCPEDTFIFTSPNPCLSSDISTDRKINLSEAQSLECPEDFTQFKKDIFTCLPITIYAFGDEILHPKPGQNVTCQSDHFPVVIKNGTQCILKPQTFDGTDLKVHEMRPEDKLDCPSIFPSEDLPSDGPLKKSQCGGMPKVIDGSIPDSPYPRDIDQFSCAEGSYINEIIKDSFKTRECRKQSIILWEDGQVYPKSKETVLKCPKDHELQSDGTLEWCIPTGPDFYLTESDCDEDSDFVANYSFPAFPHLKPIYALPNVVHNVKDTEEEFICPDGYDDIRGDDLTKYLQTHSALHWVSFAE